MVGSIVISSLFRQASLWYILIKIHYVSGIFANFSFKQFSFIAIASILWFHGDTAFKKFSSWIIVVEEMLGLLRNTKLCRTENRYFEGFSKKCNFRYWGTARWIFGENLGLQKLTDFLKMTGKQSMSDGRDRNFKNLLYYSGKDFIENNKPQHIW